MQDMYIYMYMYIYVFIGTCTCTATFLFKTTYLHVGLCVSEMKRATKRIILSNILIIVKLITYNVTINSFFSLNNSFIRTGSK